MRFIFGFLLSLALLNPALAQVTNPGVQRSGAVTAGHLAIWDTATNNRIKDGGAPGAIPFTNCNITGAVMYATSGFISCLDPTLQNGKFLKSNDAGLAPSWASSAGGGTVTSQGATSSAGSITITATSGANPNVAAASFNFDFANIAANRILGNVTGGAAIPIALTPTQVTTFCNAFTGALSGCVAAGSGANNLLHGGNTWSAVATGDVAASAITYAKIQNVALSSLLGNPTGAPAAASEITLGASLGFSASILQRAALTGDATAAVDSNAITVAKVNGIAYSATAAAHSVEVITTANTTATAKAIPDCAALGSALQFTQSSDNFSCATTTGYLLDSIAVLTATNASYTPPAGTRAIYVKLVAGGGGGGFVTGVAATPGVGSGGAGGGCALKMLTSINAPYNITIPAGGAGGVGLGSVPATAGSDASIVDASVATVVKAAGGGAGTGETAAAAPHFTAEGTGSTTGAVGDLVFPGGSGGYGMALAAAVGASGAGGPSGCGDNSSGVARVTVGNGFSAAANTGNGGGGAVSVTAVNRDGGAGGSGYAILWLYR